MNYYVHNIETANARIYKKSHCQFDYIEPDAFEHLPNSEKSLIGYIKLEEIEKDAASDQVIISSGINDHYFQLMPTDQINHQNKRNLIGYIMVAKDTYAAVYKGNLLLPIILSVAFLTILFIFML